MNREDLLVRTSDGKPPEPCSDYDEKSGCCKSTDRQCDACYENSMKMWTKP